jgi:hypothetical protein
MVDPIQNLKSRIHDQSDDELRRGAVRCFNTRDWWMAHELFEELWRRHSGADDARVYQGLLQAAVCLYHFGNGNFGGARTLARSALELLKQIPGDAMGMRVSSFRDSFASVTAELFLPGNAAKPLRPQSIPDL